MTYHLRKSRQLGLVCLTSSLFIVASGCGGGGSTLETFAATQLTANQAISYDVTAMSSQLIFPSGDGLEAEDTAALLGLNLSAEPVHALLADSNGDGFDDDLIASTASDALDYDISPDSPICSVHGDPLAGNQSNGKGILLSEPDPQYAKEKIACMLSVRGSPETVPGAINVTRRIICAIEDVLGSDLEFQKAAKT